MEAAHIRYPRYYQRVSGMNGKQLRQSHSHGFYNQYQPSDSLKDGSWSLWQDLPPPAPARPRCRWCSVLAAVTAFLVILAVILIAGLAIYIGALKLETSQYLMFEGSFRVVSGDSYDFDLSDHSSDSFKKKVRVYSVLIESIFRRSELSPAVKQSSVLGFTNGSLVVFFRLILDRRKIPKKIPFIEEQVQTILLKGAATVSLVKNLKIDNIQVVLKRPGEELNYTLPFEKFENNNQSVEIHNGLLRKSPPRTMISHYTRKPFDKAQIPKPTTTYDGIIEGSFKLSSSEAPENEHTTLSPLHYYSETTSKITKSLHSSISNNQTSQNWNTTIKKSSYINTTDTSSIDFYQHSPALSALLLHKLKLDKEQTSTSTTVTRPTKNNEEIDLITLLPFAFQHQEAPWKPILPENFTRYPERRPHVTEDYSTQGVGMVEVVLDPEDLTSSSPHNPVWPDMSGIRTQEYYNLGNPIDISELTIENNPVSQSQYYGKEKFSPRSDDKITFLLNTQTEKDEEYEDDTHKGVLVKYKEKKEERDNSSLLNDDLPDFPIIQQFHNLDALLRSYSLKDQISNHKTSETPVVTLLPTRSNVNMKKQIRPRPQIISENISHSNNSTEKSENTHQPTTLLSSQIKLEIKPTEESSKSQSGEDITTTTDESTTMIIKEIESTAIPGNHNKKIEDIPYEVTESDTTLNSESTKFLKTFSFPDNISETTTIEDLSEVTQLNRNKQFYELFTKKDLLPPTTMTSRNHRQSKMADLFRNEDTPIKFDLQEDQNNNPDHTKEKTTPSNDNVKKGLNATQQSISSSIIKLKDTKMQEVLEQMILYNLTRESHEAPSIVSSESTNYTPLKRFNSTGNTDLNVVHNRKYDHSYNDNKNSLMRNTTLFDLKQDILYYLKHPKNESSHAETYFNNLVKNNNSVGNKTSPNYVLNKDGFLMLTKVFNKAPITAHSNEKTAKSNTSSDHLTDCSGSMRIMCGSGECINALSRCNHLVDCSDGSDEKNCTCAEFLKAQYLTRKICDGVVDCWDFSDENSCEWCTIGQYVCSNSRVCVDKARVCDGDIDCPNGDDEKNCVSIAPNISQADSMKYHSSGTLMIRKEGHWGKLCTENFDELSSIFKSRWTLDDLGKVVCKKITFRSLNSIEHIRDTDEDELQSNRFYKLLYSKEAAQLRSSRLGLTFGNTNCTERKVVQITCSNLECGVRPNVNSQWGRTKRLAGVRRSRIVGGGNAGPGSWPWLAALYKEGEFQCGATLISEYWLLSAGHCFYHALDEYWVARLGALRRGTNLPSPYEQLRPVSRILLHPQYVDAGFVNDISLLRLEKPVTLTSYVRPICLPPPTAPLLDGRLCTVIGWGQLFEVGRIFPDTLQEVQLPVISTAECRKRTLFLPLYKVTENMFCAGYDRGGRDACLGDSGGPLMCQESNGHWTLMGVTSNGYGCARANRPGVYTKVANYVDWIESSMTDKGDTGPTRSRQRNVTCHGHRCPLGECLPPARICNGFMECSDGSDEKDCW